MPAHRTSAAFEAAAEAASTDPGATAWLLAAAALALLMTPGIALYYGGMVRARHVLSLLMQSYTVIALVSLLWMLVGFTLVFGGRGGFVGDLGFAGLLDMDQQVPGFEGARALEVPATAFAVFQMMPAVLVPAIITGATADRMRFGVFVALVVIWVPTVYAPIAHWTSSPLGWAASMGALDFAGGIGVHATAGAASLALVLVLGRRRGWPEAAARPHNVPLALVGAALLWFGWLGANAGSALRADGVAATALLGSQVSAAAGLLAWVAVERLRYGRPTTLGAASGAIAGLVAATPCAGYVSPPAAALVGLLAGAACAGAVSLKLWFRLDDALDVVGVHLVGAVVGVLAVGLFASREVNPAGRDGVFAGGGYALLGAQALVLVVAVAYAFALTYLIAGLLDRVVGLRVPARAERLGLDLALHGESAYAGDTPMPGVPGPRPPAASPAVRVRPSPPGEPPEPAALAPARQDVRVAEAPGSGGTDA